jgi:hypothetical protein
MRTPERHPRPLGCRYPPPSRLALSTTALLLRHVKSKLSWLPIANVGESKVEFEPTLVATGRTCAQQSRWSTLSVVNGTKSTSLIYE